MDKRKQLIIALIVFAIYCGLILTSNILMEMSISMGNETYEMVSGILFGFIAIPIFSLIIPLWLARRWNLNYSFWTKTKRLILVIPIFVIYVFLCNYETIRVVMSSGISLLDFATHYTSCLLFHVTYYPLLAVFIFPVMRKNFGLIWGILLTSLAFAVYHLFQYHFFPAGATLYWQIVLFMAFTVNLLLYLWSESLILIALAHSFAGAFGLISGGELFNQVDFVFYLTVVIMVLLFGYMIYYEVKYQKSEVFNESWWLRVSIKGKNI